MIKYSELTDAEKDRFRRTHKNADRALYALKLREEGHTYKEIGALVGGVTVERARQIVLGKCQNSFRRMREGGLPGVCSADPAPSFYSELSTRLLNCLINIGVVPERPDPHVNVQGIKENIIKMLASGDIHPRNKMCQNFGFKSYRELCRWVGVTPVSSLPSRRRHATKKAQYTWHDVVMECERVLGCPDTAESPLTSNLVNLVRDLKHRVDELNDLR